MPRNTAGEKKVRSGNSDRIRETQKQRRERQRQERLALIREQVASGDLTIRRMTQAERKEAERRRDAIQRQARLKY